MARPVFIGKSNCTTSVLCNGVYMHRLTGPWLILEGNLRNWALEVAKNGDEGLQRTELCPGDQP